MEDFRLSLCAATKEEEVKVLEEDAQCLLLVYLNWPLQSAFLETAEKVWRFLDIESFNFILKRIWDNQKNRKDFDYSRLLVDFWDKSPKSLKEAVENNPSMKRAIKSIFNKIKRRKNNQYQIRIKLSGLEEVEDWKVQNKHNMLVDIQQISSFRCLKIFLQ